MIFKTIKMRLIDLAIVAYLFLLIACNSKEDPSVTLQHIQAHQSKIVSIEVDAVDELLLFVNQTIQFQAYGLLADGSRLQTEPDSDDNVTDRDISRLVTWSVSDPTIVQVSPAGLLTSSEVAGAVTIMATFAELEASAMVVVTDEKLSEIIIDTTVTDVDGCRNLEVLATGILTNGNQIALDGKRISWLAENTNPDIIVGKFNDETVGSLSTSLSGTVDITALAVNSEITSLPVSITVNDGLEKITLTNLAEDTVNVGESVEITATGQYSDGSFDITANTAFLSSDDALAFFTDNILTSSAGTQGGTVEIAGTCNSVTGELSINIVNL